jgi:hypothetical protein
MKNMPIDWQIRHAIDNVLIDLTPNGGFDKELSDAITEAVIAVIRRQDAQGHSRRYAAGIPRTANPSGELK